MATTTYERTQAIEKINADTTDPALKAEWTAITNLGYGHDKKLILGLTYFGLYALCSFVHSYGLGVKMEVIFFYNFVFHL
jgi:hypothetical protein